VSARILTGSLVHRAATVVAAGGPAPGHTRAGAPVVLGNAARRMPRVVRRITAVHAAVFLLSRGRVLSRWFGNPILVLETVGRRTGERRLTPLVYRSHRDDFAVLPANAGADRPPAWWLNLQAAGEGFAVLNGQRHRITPTIATGPEHDRLWQQFRAVAPVEHYQRRAGRALPIVVLTRAVAPLP
jgi:F420H(2)-dependent quinone reductase